MRRSTWPIGGMLSLPVTVMMFSSSRSSGPWGKTVHSLKGLATTTSRKVVGSFCKPRAKHANATPSAASASHRDAGRAFDADPQPRKLRQVAERRRIATRSALERAQCDLVAIELVLGAVASVANVDGQRVVALDQAARLVRQLGREEVLSGEQREVVAALDAERRDARAQPILEA